MVATIALPWRCYSAAVALPLRGGGADPRLVGQEGPVAADKDIRAPEQPQMRLRAQMVKISACFPESGYLYCALFLKES
jgi:hypothetical protein